MPFDLSPIAEFFEERLDDLRKLFVHPVEKRVAIQERAAVPGINTAVKAVLRAIPGLEVVDLDVPIVSTQASHLSVLPKFKAEVREKEFAAAREAGVTAFASLFHGCHRELVKFQPDVPFELINFMELIGEAMGIRVPDLYKRLQAIGDVDAIIADSSGGEKVYFAEMPLPGGAVLQKIQPDLVILSRSGQLEVLRLPRAAGGASAAPSAASSAPRFPAVQAEVEEFVAQNTAGFLEVVRPQPFMPNGQLKGYRIYPGPNRQQFAALGLRAGDLITEINGVVLNNPAQGTEVFRSLGDATQVTVTLERDGQPQVMSLNLSQVSPAGGATQ